MTRYGLGSAAMIHAPGLIRWLIVMYRDDPTLALKLLADGWQIPTEPAMALLSCEVGYTVEDEAVVFYHGEPVPQREPVPAGAMRESSLTDAGRAWFLGE